MTFSLLIAAAVAAPAPVDFDRDVRPILSEHCFQCHGPDQQRREADLRLDIREGLFAVRDGTAIVAPGKPGDSELWARVSDQGELRMPPAEATTIRPLSKRQRETIRAWIAEGAVWRGHWAFEPPRRPAPPEVKDASWGRNAIDRFVLSQLERRGWRPSPEADKNTLIRRVTLDLTGLPPTPAEVDAFVADRRPDAYARLVDRLLASPAYGERMALRWLDYARYADTSGYQNDGPRSMWRWRDWVISAYNRSLPYDQFTIEQLAGDLLPSPTRQQRIATGFNRNHRGNAEGGIIPEEYAVEYVVDRVDTTFTVWLGLTIGCARCHDHKYDPISQRSTISSTRSSTAFPNTGGRSKRATHHPPFPLPPMPSGAGRRRSSGSCSPRDAGSRICERRSPAGNATGKASWPRSTKPSTGRSRRGKPLDSH